MIELKAVNVQELLHDKPASRIASFIFSAIFIALFACPAVFMIIGFFSAGNFSFYSLLFVIPVALILFRILKRAKNILPGPEWRVLAEAETLRMGDTVSLQWNALKREAWAKSVRIDLGGMNGPKTPGAPRPPIPNKPKPSPSRRASRGMNSRPGLALSLCRR